MNARVEVYKPQNAMLRLVTATSLFDGHDAAINIMRRIIQDTGAEVIHLGHNRSVQEIVEPRRVWHLLGATSGTDTNIHSGVSVAFTYAALPNPFQAGSALHTGNFPRIMVQT